MCYVIKLLAKLITHLKLFSILSGVVLAFLCGIAHNYFHQANNWRMFYFDLTSLSSMDWRVSHALSHHLYTNTFYDWEISGMEPFMRFLPEPHKNLVAKYTSPLLCHVTLPLFFLTQYIKNIISVCFGVKKIRLENFFIIAELLLLIVLSGGIKIGFR